MQVNAIKEAITWLEKLNADLEPELLTAGAARELLGDCARAEKLIAFAKTSLTRKLDDVQELARVTGTSVGKAKATVETAKALQDADVVRGAFAGGDISLDQAAELVKAEKAQPGSAAHLLTVAKDESFNVLRDQARRVVLEAEQHRGLPERQKEARTARFYEDDLGMINLCAKLPPTLGRAIANRADAEARRLQRAARQEGRAEPFDRHLADAVGGMLSGADTSAKPRRPELVVLVSHGVAQRGWTDVQKGEVCKIPGVGPVAPEAAREIAEDAFLSGVLYDGVDLRQMRRWTRNTPVEVRMALELGEPPEFDGVKCVDCGNRFRNENDHDLEPHCTGGPASTDNLKPRCWKCHQAKTERDRKAGRLQPGAKRAPPET
jgi:hypothetical protein